MQTSGNSGFKSFAISMMRSHKSVRMLWYVLRETRNALFKSYCRYYILGFLVLCILANIAMACFRSIYGMNDGSFSYNLIIFAEGAFVLPYYSCIFLADMVYGPEKVDPHIKDGITSGLNRFWRYFGKFLASLLLGGIMFVVGFVMLLLTTCLFSVGDGSIGMDTLADFMQKALVALPLWMAGIAIAQAFLFAMETKKKAFIGFYILVLLIPRLVIFLASERIRLFPFTKLIDVIITPRFQELQFFFTMNPARCAVLGAVYTVIATAVGVGFFYGDKLKISARRQGGKGKE